MLKYIKSIGLATLFLLNTVPTLANTSNSMTAAEQFRNVFYSLLNENTQNYSKDDFDKLIYVPKDGMFNEASFKAQSCATSTALPSSVSQKAVEQLCGIASIYNDADIWTASTFYQLGKEASSKGFSFPLELSRQSVKQKDVLIVVVPGIFGEFIEQLAFDEVLRPDSLFKSEMAQVFERQKKLDGITDCATQDKTGQTKACDAQDVLKYLRDTSLDTAENKDQPNGFRSVPLSQLFHFGSFDQNGESWARVALLNVEGMTLESLGDSRDRARIFNRRLEKLFSVLGRVPQNIIFVGYSRGTGFALDMLSQAQTDGASWLPNTKALVSLGGVVFGSALADEIFVDTNTVAAQEIQLLQLLRNTLTPVSAKENMAYEQSRIIAMNSMAWIKFINEYIALKVPGAKSKLASLRTQGAVSAATETAKMVLQFVQENANKNGGTDPSSAVNLALTQAQRFGFLPDLNILSDESVAFDTQLLADDLQKAQEFDFEAMGRLFKTGREFSGVLIDQYEKEGLAKYNADILRFQKLADAVVVGVQQLTTDSRLEWWSKNTIPRHITYYNLSATMDKKTSGLVNNRLGYNPGSPDDDMLSGNWKKFFGLKTMDSLAYMGSALNDSQVSIYKTYFWPELIGELNSANAGIKADTLGILGTHHWGLALPIVNKVKVIKENPSGLLEHNPFPRANLLKAIAITVTERGNP